MAKIPRNAHQLSDMSPQKWANEVQTQLTKMGALSPHQAKCAFLGKSIRFTTTYYLSRIKSW